MSIWQKDLALSHRSPHRPLTSYKVSEKTNDPIPRKLLERRTDGRTGPIHRTLPAKAGGTKTEVKDEGAMQSSNFKKYDFANVQKKLSWQISTTTLRKYEQKLY